MKLQRLRRRSRLPEKRPGQLARQGFHEE